MRCAKEMSLFKLDEINYLKLLQLPEVKVQLKKALTFTKGSGEIGQSV